MPARRYDKATIDRMAEMREAGATQAEIARRTGMSEGAVADHCRALGLGRPGPMPTQRSIPTEQVTIRRGAHVVRLFTAAEDELIERMSMDGASNADIARKLGRRRHSVRGRLMTLARRAERALEEQHDG